METLDKIELLTTEEYCVHCNTIYKATYYAHVNSNNEVIKHEKIGFCAKCKGVNHE